MELWDLYTQDRELTGKEHIRGEEIPDNMYHLVVHVWIKNSKGEYLISQRSANRPTFPLMWECVGGSVLKGESSIDGAIREAKEEVGVELQHYNGKLVFSKIRQIVDGKKFNDIVDVWLFQYDDEVTLKNATTDEVTQTVWMNKSQILDLFKQNKLVDTLKYFFTEIDK
mgnify:CR=1 FL=1